jgi:alpha/beta superfamily hydrolase
VPVEAVVLEAADGVTLTGEVATNGPPWAAAVLAHPHPRYGGDMYNTVVDAAFRALAAAGVAAVRFDFRGVGRSGGTMTDGPFTDGIDERLDVVAAIDAATPFAGDGPVLLFGYSFGALVALSVADPRIDGWMAVAPPLLLPTPAPPLAAHDHRPVLLLAPAHDQFTPPAAMKTATEGWKATTVEEVAMADHFLAGASAAVARRTVTFLRLLGAR